VEKSGSGTPRSLRAPNWTESKQRALVEGLPVALTPRHAKQLREGYRLMFVLVLKNKEPMLILLGLSRGVALHPRCIGEGPQIRKLIL
jgi:hypothetical protein